MHLRNLDIERTRKELHQDRHLLGGPAPVLARECEQRQVFDAELDGCADGGTHGLALVVDMAERISYVREDGCNRVLLALRRGDALNTPAGPA